MQACLDNSSLSEDHKKIATQMLKLYPPSEIDLANGYMNANTIAANMRERVIGTAKDWEHKTQTALDNYAGILAATLGPFLQPKNLPEAMQQKSLADTQKLLAQTQELLALARESGRSNILHDEGITETAIIRLAQRIAGDTDDLGQAWLTLQDAMDTAVKVQREGRTPSNHGDFVNEVLARVAELAAQGEYADASHAIDLALSDEGAAHERRKTRLLQSGVELARLQGDAARAATLLLQQADLAAGEQAEFEVLCNLQNGYYETGRDKGTALDLRIAIDIAGLILARATTMDERGTALNDLGNALQTLGMRETGTARLEAAITHYENALKERTRDRVPQDWAMTEMNLGAALQTLGERETDTARLEAAVTHYENALKEYTRDRVPLDWARTQMNLGNALKTLGERETGTARLETAVTHYENALKERTRDRVPLQWARAQMNLGNALQTLGQRETGTARLEAAVTHYENALKEMTRDRVPLDWAMTQMNLGNALKTLGQRETGTARLEAAVTHYENALKEYTRDRVPLGWAKTKGNLVILELAIFEKTGDPAHLDQALAHAMAAKEIFKQAQASLYIGMVDRDIAKITALRDGG